MGEKKKERLEWRTRKNTTTRRPNLWVRVGLQTQPPHTFTVWVIQKLGPQGGESKRKSVTVYGLYATYALLDTTPSE